MTTETKNIFETTTSDISLRGRNTMAAAAGAVVGVGLTALSERANATTIGATAALGAVATMAVYGNGFLHALVPDNIESKVMIGAVTGIQTGIFGCLMNVIAGDDVAAE